MHIHACYNNNKICTKKLISSWIHDLNLPRIRHHTSLQALSWYFWQLIIATGWPFTSLTNNGIWNKSHVLDTGEVSEKGRNNYIFLFWFKVFCRRAFMRRNIAWYLSLLVSYYTHCLRFRSSLLLATANGYHHNDDHDDDGVNFKKGSSAENGRDNIA